MTFSFIRKYLSFVDFVPLSPSNELCPVPMFKSKGRASGLKEHLLYRPWLLEVERSAFAKDHADLICVPSFAQFPSEPPSSRSIHKGLRHLFPAVLTASMAAGPTLEEQKKRNAACKAFSIFCLCIETSTLKTTCVTYSNVKTTARRSSLVFRKPKRRKFSSWAPKSLMPSRVSNCYEMSWMPVSLPQEK